MAVALVEDSVNTGACISFQVVQEVLNVLTRNAISPDLRQGTSTVLEEILIPMWRVMPSPTLYLRAVEIRERYSYTFYDSLIIAAALEGGCTRLYSEDLQHGQRIERMTIVNPFL